MSVKSNENGVLDSVKLTAQEIARRIETETYCQVRDLGVDLSGDRVRVTGSSHSYYVKQLVTRAVLTAVPTARLLNEIIVLAS